MRVKLKFLFLLLGALKIALVKAADEIQLLDDELSGPNVCKRLEDYTVEVLVVERHPYQVRKTVWCPAFPPRCTKFETQFKQVNRTQLIKKERVVRECCAGFGKNIHGDRCIPVCTQGCKHGDCLAPDHCQCELGYGGPACDIGKFGLFFSLVDSWIVCR